MTTMNNIPDWEEKYRDEKVDSMPWYYEKIDPDFEEALNLLNIKSGTALDIGAGAGTQAIELAKRGFEVIGTDISLSAVKNAEMNSEELNLNLSFLQDDILNSKLNKQFDVVCDRGCCHVFPPETIPDYVRKLKALVKPEGYLLLKCYSHLESEIHGPYCYRHEDIYYCFSSLFNVLSIKDTLFYGSLEYLPKALFCVLKSIS